MQRRRLNLVLDWLLVASGFVAFSTGLVLLVRFHMGDGAFATTGLGLGRLVWLNLHRFAATLLTVGVATHVALHWRAFSRTILNAIAGSTKKRIHSEPVMYGAFTVAALAGFVAWLILDGSSPVSGPAIIGRASGARHPWIDAHHLSSLVTVVLVVHHTSHRWRLMTARRQPPAARQMGTAAVPTPASSAYSAPQVED